METSATILTTVLGSGLLAAFVSGTVILFAKAREERVVCVAKERKAWRDRLRSIASGVAHLAEAKDGVNALPRLQALAAELETRLNPSDAFDERIVRTAADVIAECRKGATEGAPSKAVKRLNEMIAQRLKHDWERAKIEATVPYKHIAGAVLSSAALVWTACHSLSFEGVSIAPATVSHLFVMVFVFLAFLLIVTVSFALMRTFVEEAVLERIAPATVVFLAVAVFLLSGALFCFLVRQPLSTCSPVPQNPSALLLFILCLSLFCITPTFIVLSVPTLVVLVLAYSKQKKPSGLIGVLQFISHAFFLLPKYYPETPQEENTVHLVRVTPISKGQKEIPGEEKVFSVKVARVPKDEKKIRENKKEQGSAATDAEAHERRASTSPEKGKLREESIASRT